MLSSGFLFLSVGAVLRNHLVDSGWTQDAGLLAVLFFSMAPLALALAELLHWLVDVPSVLVARWLFVYFRQEDLFVFPTDLSVGGQVGTDSKTSTK